MAMSTSFVPDALVNVIVSAVLFVTASPVADGLS
jgi:hypothetical protein